MTGNKQAVSFGTEIHVQSVSVCVCVHGCVRVFSL